MSGHGQVQLLCGHPWTPAGGTLTPNVAGSTLKPDIVDSTVDIFELTPPAEHRIKTANRLKAQKYSHFETDNINFKTSAILDSGYVTRDNKARLASLHKFCKKSIKLKNFERNVSAITIIGSYYIFNCSSQDLWPEMAPILAPFPNQ
jgi:hypothetical protein